MNAYHAELCGLMSVLFLLLWVCTKIKIEEGTTTIYCDNTTALDEVFNTGKLGNNPYSYLQSDINLITDAQITPAVPLSGESEKGMGKMSLYRQERTQTVAK
jgi:hypothetical protein